MRAALFAVGCIGLFGCAPDYRIEDSLNALRGIIQRARRRAEDITKCGGATWEEAQK